MCKKVLLVDDDPNVLKAYSRRLRKRFEVETALCSEEGVTAVNFLGPFAVVVSDMKMPREDGAHFLAKILDTAPDSVRIMLTGNADQQAAADAINVGRVFRFLNKPCPAEELESAIEAGIVEHRRLKESRDLVGKTVRGCVAMLTRVLSLADPPAFGRAERLGRLAAEIAQAAGVDDRWEIETAGLLSQLGVFTVPMEIRRKVRAGEDLNDSERRVWLDQYRVAAELIAEAPRLERVARIVGLQSGADPEGALDAATGFAADAVSLAIAFDHQTRNRSLTHADALKAAVLKQPRSDYAAFDALTEIVARDVEQRSVDVDLADLTDGMRLIDDVETTDGTLLVAQGQEVTAALRGRLTAYATTHDIREPIRVLAPAGAAAEAAPCPA